MRVRNRHSYGLFFLSSIETLRSRGHGGSRHGGWEHARKPKLASEQIALWQVVRDLSFWKGQHASGINDELAIIKASHRPTAHHSSYPPSACSFLPQVRIGGRRCAGRWGHAVESRCSLPSKSVGFCRGPRAQTTGREVLLQQKPERHRVFSRCVDIKEEMLASAGRGGARRGFIPSLTEDRGVAALPSLLWEQKAIKRRPKCRARTWFLQALSHLLCAPGYFTFP